MRSLFLKIFLWFWLAMALMGLAVISVTWTMRAEPVVPAQRGLLGEAMERNARVAALLIETRGPQEVEAFLARVNRKARVNGLFFDENGKLLAGKRNRSGAAELAKLAAKRDDLEFSLSGVDVLAARRAISRSGKTYVLVATMPRGLLSALRVQPETRLLRLGATLLVAGLVCFGLARYLTVPIIKLRHATRRFAGGDLSVRVAPQLGRRRDEITELARDFDAMAERISTLLTAQKRLLGDVSHELRTPLTRLNIALELARRNAGPQAAPALDRIEREAAQLNELIGQLLTLSRLESDAAPRESVDLAALLKSVVADAELEAHSENKRIEIVSVCECAVLGTPSVLQSALENVIRNALRHTPNRVEMSLLCDDEWARLTVRDYGPGLPEDVLNEIFRPFFRVETARDRQSGGVGLGLAIVERAITSHGGKVAARNATDGGLIVEISLPRQITNPAD
jgi:signal transduction histidine kinase